MKFRSLKHIFFDLDHTLWDFETNSRETLQELVDEYTLDQGLEVSFELFIDTYSQVNSALWKAWRENKIEGSDIRHRRFRESFEQLGMGEPEWVEQFGLDYMHRCPRKSHLIPTVLESLEKIHRHYPLHLITNGFQQTQGIKLQHSGLAHLFGEMITSECAQAKKPDPKIFKYALNLTGALPEHSLYVGDNYEADILGGLNAGMQVVYFNPNGMRNPLNVTEIREISELVGLLV